MIRRTMSGRQVVQHRAFGALCQREGQRDEDDQTGIEEDRHGHHKAGDAQCPCSFFRHRTSAPWSQPASARLWILRSKTNPSSKKVKQFATAICFLGKVHQL